MWQGEWVETTSLNNIWTGQYYMLSKDALSVCQASTCIPETSFYTQVPATTWPYFSSSTHPIILVNNLFKADDPFWKEETRGIPFHTSPQFLSCCHQFTKRILWQLSWDLGSLDTQWLEGLSSYMFLNSTDTVVIMFSVVFGYYQLFHLPLILLFNVLSCNFPLSNNSSNTWPKVTSAQTSVFISGRHWRKILSAIYCTFILPLNKVVFLHCAELKTSANQTEGMSYHCVEVVLINYMVFRSLNPTRQLSLVSSNLQWAFFPLSGDLALSELKELKNKKKIGSLTVHWLHSNRVCKFLVVESQLPSEHAAHITTKNMAALAIQFFFQIKKEV